MAAWAGMRHDVAMVTGGLGLEGKVAVVTGGGRGIGRACVLGLAAEGATVITVESDEQAAGSVVAEAGDLGGEVVVIGGDACDTAILEHAAAEAKRRGGLEVAVNVVGGAAKGRPMRPGPALDADPEDWSATIDSTLLPPFLGCKVFGRTMIDGGRGGAIVNIGASLALRAAPHLAAFAAAKAGLHQYTQSLSFELAPHGVRVNCIAPLFVDTPGSRAAVDDKRRSLSAAAIPLGRIAQPDDIAGVVLFLASPRLSSFVTGQVIVVDGGLFCTTLRPPRGWTPPPGYVENLSG